MKHHLYISSFKKLLLGFLLGFCLVSVGSIVINYIIKNSNHRLAKIYGKNSINEYSIFFIGNSRSVPFNSSNLNSNKILNLSHNSMTAFEVENIIKSIKIKQTNKKKIYIELTSLSDDSIQCLYSIFYDFRFYYGKSEIKNKCKRQFYFENFFPISKINNELFYRILYYYFFPKKDQLWTNNYIMPKTTCDNPKQSPLMNFFFSKASEENYYKRSAELIRKYSDKNTKIFFFISPVYQKTNLALNMENNLSLKKMENFLQFNTFLDKKFFKNCDMFTDTLHLSSNGVQNLKKTIFNF